MGRERSLQGLYAELEKEKREAVKTMLKGAAKTMNWEEGMKLALSALLERYELRRKP